MWWLYFDRGAHEVLNSAKRAFVWGSGHLVVYAVSASVAAGLLVAMDEATGHGDAGPWLAGMAVAVPAALFLAALWLLHERPRHQRGSMAMPVVAGAILITPWLAESCSWSVWRYRGWLQIK